MSYTFLFSIFALIFFFFWHLKSHFQLWTPENKIKDVILCLLMPKICRAIPDQSHRIRSPRVNPTVPFDWDQPAGRDWMADETPPQEIPSRRGALCSVKDNVTIQRLSHSRNTDWGGCEDWERLRPSCTPSQRLSLFLCSSEVSGTNNSCSLRCLWKLLSEGSFHLAPTGIKFSPSWMHRGEHSLCLALRWLNCTC